MNRHYKILIAVLVGGIFYLSSNYQAIWEYFKHSLREQSEIVTETEQSEQKLTQKIPDMIQIPVISISAPVIYDSGYQEEEIVDNLNEGVVFYSGSDRPDQDGLTILFGHSSNYWWRQGKYDTVFSLISQLETGDEITLMYVAQPYYYRVNEKQIISSKDWHTLNDPTKKGLALVTCWPLGTDWRRYVVWAEKFIPQ